jgi:hypothetical protein
MSLLQLFSSTRRHAKATNTLPAQAKAYHQLLPGMQEAFAEMLRMPAIHGTSESVRRIQQSFNTETESC